MIETNWSAMSDEDFFKPDRVVWQHEADEFKKERDKRLNQKRLEQERAEKERFERVNAVKENLTYSDQLASEICERISSGELLTVICRDEHMPTMRRCQQWLKERSEFQAVFNMSIQDRLFVFEEQVVEIADDMRNDFKTVIKNGREKRVADPDMVARAKLRIEVRFRHLRSGRPQKWGDVSTLITKSEDPLNPSSFSDEELERKLADLETKDRVFKAA